MHRSRAISPWQVWLSQAGMSVESIAHPRSFQQAITVDTTFKWFWSEVVLVCLQALTAEHP
jgi:hypothetical protein